MAAKRKQTARGRSERRTAPARGSKARGAAKKKSGLRRAIAATKKTTKAPTRKPRPARRRFAPADRVYHLIDPAEFVTVTTDGVARTAPREGQLTTCCSKPIADVYAVALSRDAFDPPVDNWCPVLTHD